MVSWSKCPIQDVPKAPGNSSVLLTGGDRVGTLPDYITDGLIAWTAPWAVSVFDQGDGHTYIGCQDARVPLRAAGRCGRWQLGVTTGYSEQ
jgi:hypothetical protein